MAHYDFTLLGGAAAVVPVSGSYCRVIASTGRVQVRTHTGAAYSLLEGQGFRLADGHSFSDLTITDLSGAPNVGTLFVGTGSFEDSRISGTVAINYRIAAGVQQLAGSANVGVGISVTTLVPQVNNLRGLTVRTCTAAVTSGAGGFSELRYVAAATTPSGGPGSAFPASGYSFTHAYSSNGVKGESVLLLQNFTLPAGWGVFVVGQNITSAAASGGWEFAYELL